jgi:hypothetical protein
MVLFIWRLAIIKLGDWGDLSLEARLMEVGEGVSLAGIQADLVGGGW